MVYVANRGGMQQLHLRPMDSFEAEPLPDTEGALAPFFSTDGKWIGFFADNKLKKISITGGAAVTLCAARGNFFSAAWGANDTIVFQNQGVGDLWQVSAAGGTPKRLNTLAKGESTSRLPAFSPSGKVVLFTAGNGGAWGMPKLHSIGWTRANDGI